MAIAEESKQAQADQSAAQAPAMTEQQKLLASSMNSPLGAYRDAVVGSKGYGSLVAYELYNLLLSGLPGLLGYASRRIALPWLLGKCGAGVTIGRHVSIRRPAQIRIGSTVFVDDTACLDARAPDTVEYGIELGDHSFIGKHTILSAKGGQIRLGDGANVSSHCRIATQSSIDIGESVLIAAYVYIGPGNHQMQSSDVPLIERPMAIKGGVKIGAHSWVGAHSTVLDGVTIGRDVIIGAHSLVKEDVPDRAIVAGVPAKVIRLRED